MRCVQEPVEPLHVVDAYKDRVVLITGASGRAGRADWVDSLGIRAIFDPQGSEAL